MQRKTRGLEAPSPTPRQLEVLRTIDRLTRKLGFPPTFRELGDAMDIESLNGVSDHLRALERHGWLTRTERTARAVLLTPSGSAWLATARAA